MKAQFKIIEIAVLPNGRVAVSGVTAGRHLTPGERGRTATEFGELEVEIVSVGLVDPAPSDPNAQMLQMKLLHGEHGWLKGSTIIFE